MRGGRDGQWRVCYRRVDARARAARTRAMKMTTMLHHPYNQATDHPYNHATSVEPCYICITMLHPLTYHVLQARAASGSTRH